jgi:hypothetical protein
LFPSLSDWQESHLDDRETLTKVLSAAQTCSSGGDSALSRWNNFANELSEKYGGTFYDRHRAASLINAQNHRASRATIKALSAQQDESSSDSDDHASDSPSTLPVDFEMVWVDSVTSLARFSALIAQLDSTSPCQRHLVAFDCEWRHPRPVSLIQIAMWNSGGAGPCALQSNQMAWNSAIVYLIDCTVTDQAAFEAIEYNIVKLFLHSAIPLIGFSPREDVKRLRETFQSMPDFAVFDLQKCGQQSHDGQTVSLSSLVRSQLDFDMSKTCQTSNWDRRPLKRKQLAYAALDAAVLLKVVSVMKPKLPI